MAIIDPNLINTIVFILGLVFSGGLVLTAGYKAAKKWVLDFADAIEDNRWSKEEFVRQLEDSFNLMNVFRHLIGK